VKKEEETEVETPKKIAWIVYYDDVPQDKKRFSDSLDEAIEEAQQIIQRLKREVNNDKTRIYPNEEKWQLRIFQ
jgi:hypothetical protein